MRHLRLTQNVNIQSTVSCQQNSRQLLTTLVILFKIQQIYKRQQLQLQPSLVIWSHLQALPMASRKDCLLAFTSGSTFCRSRTAGGIGRLRSVGGGGSCRHLIGSESRGAPAPAEAAFRRSTSPFLAAFSESLLPVSQKTHRPSACNSVADKTSA